jgi:hypothetical protein
VVSVIKNIVSILLVLTLIICSFALFSCTDHAKNAEDIELKIQDGAKNEQYYLIGTVNDARVWVEMLDDGPRFIFLQPFDSSVIYQGEDFEINISQNDALNGFGDRLYFEYGEAITGVFDFDITNPLWQGGVIHLMNGTLYYLTPRGEKIKVDLN